VRQLQHARPDLILSGIRGNIDTRLRKLRETPEWSGMILAAAGLERLKPEVTGLTLTPLEADTMLPAPGQGALGLQIRENDNATRASLAPVHDVVTAACVGAERAFLKGLGGGCSFPAGALAVCSNGREILLRAVAWLPRGDEWIMAGGEGQCVLDEAVELGEALAQRLKEGA
jgi:hydroxymethylbilane synthase